MGPSRVEEADGGADVSAVVRNILSHFSTDGFVWGARAQSTVGGAMSRASAKSFGASGIGAKPTR